MTNKGKIYCTVNGWDCPYYKMGECSMYPDADPFYECEDFRFFWDEGDDYISFDE